MSHELAPSVGWVVLTRGDRPDALDAAVASISPAPVLVVMNGAADGPPAVDRSNVSVAPLPVNRGVPGGRDIGLRRTDAEVVAFLDDDAEASAGLTAALRDAFESDPRLGAVALRIVDEHGRTARRHVPRLGGRRADVGGPVALFLGGACAIRREAYLDSGGYWTELFYGHEELELAWRLVDRGWSIRYLADQRVLHPQTEIGRHPEGWRMTGRNRVRIARRTLPWPIAAIHVASWLIAGVLRAPTTADRRAYVAGWWAGWHDAVERAPIRWRTVWRLTRLGRPPIV